MYAQENKSAVIKYLACFGQSDIQSLLHMMAKDATWWVNGSENHYPNIGERSKAEMADVWRNIFSLLDSGLVMEPISVIAEGDRVAAEVRASATTKLGKIYENHYVLLFTLRHGQITEVREYTDLLYATGFFEEA